MNWLRVSSLAAVAALALAGGADAQQFTNPGFEDPITSDGAPFVGFWEGFAGGNASAANSTTTPRNGTMSVALNLSAPNTFAGVFQDIPGLTPGQQRIFSGWHRTPSSPLNLGVEVRIEWRNSVSNTEVDRTLNSTPVPTGDYAQFTLPVTVPAGADTARTVYAIQSFSTNPLGSGQVIIDDFSFAVPEPASAGLLAVGIMAVTALKRRR
jgi:hypothetical protein